MKKNSFFYLFLILIVSLSLFSLSFYQLDPDYLWHIKAGEYMFQHGPLRQDIFSWVLSSSYWFSHEWLFEVVICLLKNIFGKYHLFIYCFSCVFLIFFLLFYYNRDSYLKNISFSLLWVVLSLVLCVQIQVRPHLISYVFFSIMMCLLFDNYQNEDSNKIYLLPIIGILWSNFHGGSSNLVYLFPFFFILGGVFSFRLSKIESSKISFKQLKKYVVVCLLCIISVCINIHGIKMLLYPYLNMSNTLMLSNISEWRSTSLNEPLHYIYFFLLLLIVGVLIFNKKKIRFLDFLLCIICVYLGLKSIRFWFYTYIVVSFFICDYVNERKKDAGSSLGIILLSFILVTLFFTRNTIFSGNYSYFLTDEDILAIKKENPTKLFNMYNYGGDLIYHDILVFIDGRADLYSSYHYDDYLSISNLDRNGVDNLMKYSFDYLLVDANYPISSYLELSSDYEKIYSRDDVLLYKKRTNY